MTDGHVGLTVTWTQPYSNILQSASLAVREFKGGLILPSQMVNRMYVVNPQLIHEKKYLPELSHAREYGWVATGSTTFLPSGDLAEQCVIEFLDLASRHGRGTATGE